MNPRTKASLLWGVIGALSFLVLLQAYELVAGQPVDLLVKFAVALVVGVGATVVTYLAEPTLAD
ncbi:MULTISPECIES: hypothetical protein [unclassified Haladaptatus]|uniref:hypothetical protein n=1 Tax=unclassified Haladaptatus TaxID=2622732 RepID=UPI0023E886E1|nr:MULTISPECIES: hypothetical protein [unclassified Haladaptatus]